MAQKDFNYLEYYQQALERIFHSKDISSGDTEEFSLIVCCPIYGWMPSRLQIGQDVFSIEFGDAYPPFLEFIRWITLIAHDENTEPVHVDDEYDNHFFHVTKTNDRDKLIFEYAREYFPGTGVYRKALVDKNDFIREWYFTLKSIMKIDFEYEEKNLGYLTCWFDFDRHASGNVIFDLTSIENYLESILFKKQLPSNSRYLFLA